MLQATCQLLFLGVPLLPAAIGQGLCIKYDFLSRLKIPLDFGRTFKGRRIFGDHKTWRGLFMNILFCALGSAIQSWLFRSNYVPESLALLDYSRYGLIVGPLMGVGMTVGELPNSFLKRRLEILPGQKGKGVWGPVFFLLDQIDLAIGIWVFLYFLVRPPFLLMLGSLWLALVLHLSISVVGYFMGMRKTIT